uniref:Uncharacterized protein n=1 Tax=Rhipicephalus zambeziensis TaxID=60191 RepID=A0A224YFX8_9ACAR
MCNTVVPDVSNYTSCLIVSRKSHPAMDFKRSEVLISRTVGLIRMSAMFATSAANCHNLMIELMLAAVEQKRNYILYNYRRPVNIKRVRMCHYVARFSTAVTSQCASS